MATEQTKPEQSPAQDLLSEWVNSRYASLAKGRWAEEREWYRAGMFKQMKQWVQAESADKRKLREIPKTKENQYFMPVSDHFSKAINTNANLLGAAIPEMVAQSDNYDGRNRHAAEAAQNALEAANRESGMDVLVSTLAQHVVLFGMGITKETVAFDHSTDEVPQLESPETTIGPDGQPVEGEPTVVGTHDVPSPRLKTLLLTPFQVYLPRDCFDANLAGVVIERARLNLSEARELYTEYADTLTKDEGETAGKQSESLADYFMNSLRYLTFSSKQDDSEEKITLTECWVDWGELSKKVQDAITDEWGDLPSTIYGDVGMSRLEAATAYGIFITCWGSVILEWGENPWDGRKPYTFYLWEKDVMSVYPKGLSVPLIPLQTQLNRYHSLADKSIMAHAAGKLLWPNTQTGPAPTGDPTDVILWDPIGQGKEKPEYISGTPCHPILLARMQQIVADMEALSLSNQAAEGNSPGAGTPFRSLAFMATKSDENHQTQRYLWESSHELRARKVIAIIRKIWSTPRKVQTAGFNNRSGAQQLAASDLQGDYQLDVQQDSSRPKTQAEKLEALQLLLQGGMINPADPSVRDYITNVLGLSDLNLADSLDYRMAERNLEAVKIGIQPQTSPYMNYPLHLSTVSEFTKTEEFFGLDPKIQAGVLAYATWLQQMAAPPALPPGAAPAPGAPTTGPNHPLAQALSGKGGIGGQAPGHVLHQIPGHTSSPDQVEKAAAIEGTNLVPNFPAHS